MTHTYGICKVTHPSPQRVNCFFPLLLISVSADPTPLPGPILWGFKAQHAPCCWEKWDLLAQQASSVKCPPSSCHSPHGESWSRLGGLGRIRMWPAKAFSSNGNGSLSAQNTASSLVFPLLHKICHSFGARTSLLIPMQEKYTTVLKSSLQSHVLH